MTKYVKRKPRAYRRPNRRYGTKRNYKKKTSTVIVKNNNGIGDRYFGKFPYAQSKTITATTSPVSLQFQASMYDPDYDVGSTQHQPWMRDQISAWYARYLCFGFKWEVILENTSAVSARWCIAPYNHAGTPASMDLAWEKPYNKHGILTPTGSAGSQRTIRGYLSCAQVQGITKKKFSMDDIYGATTGADPANQSILNICAQATDALSSIGVNVTVRLLFYTKYFDRVAIGSS